ncbi:MAG: MazG-related protein [Pseudomonadota bacterium]
MKALPKAQQAEALRWITGTAAQHALPYQICGGLAVVSHGGSRPLHDIDLYMPFADPNWAGFLDAVTPYLTWGPETVVEGQWDLTYLKLLYHGQKIEIGAAEHICIQNKATGAWVPQRIDFETSETRSVLGAAIEVMPKAQLIAYKRLLAREVDLIDIRDLEAEHPQPPPG